MIKSFKEFLLESKGDNMLDIHIPEVSKVFKKDSAIEAFLNKEFFITEKGDGCLHFDTIIQTKEFGPLPIGKIVDESIRCSVLSFNHNTSTKEFKEINGFKNSGSSNNWIKLELENNETLIVTDNHLVWSETYQKYKMVKDLEINEEVRLTNEKN